MIKAFGIKINDLQPYYFVEVLDSDGNAIDLSDATIYCTMKAAGGSIKINRQTAGITVLNQSDYPGKFYYAWQSGDTDTAGKYYIEFEVEPLSGGKFTVPTDNSAVVLIRESLDTQ